MKIEERQCCREQLDGRLPEELEKTQMILTMQGDYGKQVHKEMQAKETKAKATKANGKDIDRHFTYRRHQAFLLAKAI